MKKILRKMPDLSKHDLKKTGLLAAGIAAVVLIAMLCISISMRAHIQSEYTAARNEIGEEAYTELYMLCQTFDQVTVPGQDVQNVVIPKMEDYYLSAQTLNTALANAFGERYRILTAEQIEAIDAAFDAYDGAFRAGKSTDDAQEYMQNCIDMVRTILNARFRNGVLKAS